MSDRAVGLSFLAISVLLFAAKHIAQAAYTAGDLSPSTVRYKDLESIGHLLLFLVGLSAATGIYYFIRGEQAMRQNGDQK